MIIGVMLAAAASQAQSFKLPVTRNAALRYWEAFAVMQDQPADASTKELIEKVLSGSAPWDEQRLGPLVEQNRSAIQIMQGGTRLPECEWGEDFSAGYQAPIPEVWKARALGRLNLLHGIRALAQHDVATATTAFVTGIRFAQHLSEDGPLVSILTADNLLLSDFQIVQRSVAGGQLDLQSKMKIYDAMRSLPKDTFAWAFNVRVEGLAEESALKGLIASANPGAFYQEWFGEALPQSAVLPSETDLSALRSYVDDVARAFEMPYEVTQERLNSLETKRKSLNPMLLRVVPNFSKSNDRRKQLESAREELSQQLKS
jgi:hypothetical protein